MSLLLDTPTIDLGRGVKLRPAVLLAPMEGVTDRCFRGLLMELGGALGGACTEFLRVSQQVLPVKRIYAELGPRGATPVGAQLMGSRPELVAASAVHAAQAGAAFVDLNFGCPAPRVLQHCAGSALLDDPPLLERLVAETVRACPVPVTAKIRAGGASDERLEEIARRVEQAGAAALTVHARLRVQSYREPADWRRVRRAVAAVSIPVIGNGGADTPRRIDALFADTGCAGVMVGRGALANPWIFQDLDRHWRRQPPRRRAPSELLEWLAGYERRMEEGGAGRRQVLGRLKQALRAMAGGGAWPGAIVTTALRAPGREALFQALQAAPG